MKIFGIFLLLLGLVLNIPTLICIMDMIWWFVTDVTLSGIVYGTSARPLVAAFGSFLSVWVALAASEAL
jgi:hypothetical protein